MAVHADPTRCKDKRLAYRFAKLCLLSELDSTALLQREATGAFGQTEWWCSCPEGRWRQRSRSRGEEGPSDRCLECNQGCSRGGHCTRSDACLLSVWLLALFPLPLPLDPLLLLYACALFLFVLCHYSTNLCKGGHCIRYACSLYACLALPLRVPFSFSFSRCSAGCSLLPAFVWYISTVSEEVVSVYQHLSNAQRHATSHAMPCHAKPNLASAIHKMAQSGSCIAHYMQTSWYQMAFSKRFAFNAVQAAPAWMGLSTCSSRFCVWLVSPNMLQGCYCMFPHTNHVSRHTCVMHACWRGHVCCCQLGHAYAWSACMQEVVWLCCMPASHWMQ